MFDIHRYLGEGLFVIYVIVMGIVFVMGRRGQQAPSAVMAVAHGLLALQVALGAILFLEDPDRVTWVHPLLGLAAMLSLGLTPMFRQRLGHTRGTMAGLAVVAFLALAAFAVVRAS